MTVFVKGIIGAVITFTVKRDGTALDISAASTKNILCKTPSGTTKTFAGTFVTDGTDGKIKYTTTAASDLDVVGEWRVAASIVMTGWTGQTSNDFFSVSESL